MRVSEIRAKRIRVNQGLGVSSSKNLNCCLHLSPPNWHEAGHFPPCPFWIRFLAAYFYQNFQSFFEVKIDINRINLTPCQVLWKMPLGGSKDKYFLCFHSSCQLGLNWILFSQYQISQKYIVQIQKNELQQLCKLTASKLKRHKMIRHKLIKFEGNLRPLLVRRAVAWVSQLVEIFSFLKLFFWYLFTIFKQSYNDCYLLKNWYFDWKQLAETQLRTLQRWGQKK